MVDKKDGHMSIQMGIIVNERHFKVSVFYPTKSLFLFLEILAVW
jgi:hypothetical protein